MVWIIFEQFEIKTEAAGISFYKIFCVVSVLYEYYFGGLIKAIKA